MILTATVRLPCQCPCQCQVSVFYGRPGKITITDTLECGTPRRNASAPSYLLLPGLSATLPSLARMIFSRAHAAVTAVMRNRRIVMFVRADTHLLGMRSDIEGRSGASELLSQNLTILIILPS